MIKYNFKNNSVCSNFFLGISTSDGIFHDVSKLEVVSLLMEKYFEYGEVKGDYRDVLGDVGLVNDECILLGMPVYYEKNISDGTFDYELDYATQLAVYLNAHRRFPYRVIVCSAMAELKAFLQHKEVEMLVTVPEYRSESEKLWKEQKIQKLFFFKEAKSEEENEIYRFQSAEKIRRLLQKGELQEDDVGTVTKVGIFSSTGGVEKTKFSETLASVYAKSGKTLLLSFDSEKEYLSGVPL